VFSLYSLNVNLGLSLGFGLVINAFEKSIAGVDGSLVPPHSL
jgi:hypothetical protein